MSKPSLTAFAGRSPAYADALGQAIDYQTKDAPGALGKVGFLAERLSEEVGEAAGVARRDFDDARQYLLALEDRGIISSPVARILHDIRKLRNAAVHDLRGTPRQAGWALDKLEEVALALGFAPVHPEVAPPPPPAAAPISPPPVPAEAPATAPPADQGPGPSASTAPSRRSYAPVWGILIVAVLGVGILTFLGQQTSERPPSVSAPAKPPSDSGQRLPSPPAQPAQPAQPKAQLPETQRPEGAEPEALTDVPRSAHPIPEVRAEPPPSRGPRIVPLGSGNARDIWTTSVYSYAPGGGGPGGGLDNDRLRVGGWGDEYVSLIRFDVPDIGSGRLFLELYGEPGGEGPAPMRLYRITQDWSWRSGDRLWWARRPALSSLGLVVSPNLPGWTRIDITDWAREVNQGREANYGLALAPTRTDNRFSEFYSTDTPSAERRPRLVLED